MASKRAIEVTEARKTPISSYYINWKRWGAVMQAYEAGTPKYFATRESLFRNFSLLSPLFSLFFLSLLPIYTSIPIVSPLD